MSASCDRGWFPPAVERFVACVEAGQILKTTEFASVVSVTASNQFRDAGDCRYDSGAIIANGKTVTLLFQCRNQVMEQGLAAFLEWDGTSVKRLDVVTAEIRPELPN